jgi:twinkle protein
MQGEQVEEIPCPSCRKEGRDRSGDNLKVFEQEDGSKNGFCFSCKGGEGLFFKDPYGDVAEGTTMTKAKPSAAEIAAKIKEIGDCPIKALPERKLKRQTCEDYGVRVGFSESDGTTVDTHYYPDTKGGEICGYEVRNLEKKGFYSVGDRRGAVDLWGANVAKQAKAKNLYITEGRADCMALYQALTDGLAGTKWESKISPAVVSLTRGSSAAVKDVLNNRALLDMFDEVVLVFDNDEPGQKAVKAVLKVMPSCKVANIPKLEYADPFTGELKITKDANDMLFADKADELQNIATWKAQVVRQGLVLDVEDFIEEAMEKPKMGIPFPWPSVTRETYGLRPHTVHVIGAAPKIGKSDHEYQCIEWFSMVQKQKIGVFDLENPPKKTCKKIASKYAGLDYTKPDSIYVDDDLRRHMMAQNGIVRFYDRGASRDWADIRITIEEMHLLDGINIFFIDPLTALVSRYTSSEANDKLNAICTDIADLVYKYPISLLIYTHVNPKQKGQRPHEKGAQVLSSEFTGSRAMEKWFHYGWGIRRDRSPESEAPNQSFLDMLFDRDFGNSLSAELFFNKDDMSYLEPKRKLK